VAKTGDELHTSVPAMVYTDYPQFDFWDGFYEYASVNLLKGDNIRLLYINPGYDFIVKYKSKPSLFKTITLYSNMGMPALSGSRIRKRLTRIILTVWPRQNSTQSLLPLL